ncbi:hypothetical protein TMEN_3786 [Trichophyton mentagrophytes]|nr:hypothetical protein TMEN_3786 [Trichophyton mentagrophytes]
MVVLHDHELGSMDRRRNYEEEKRAVLITQDLLLCHRRLRSLKQVYIIDEQDGKQVVPFILQMHGIRPSCEDDAMQIRLD